MSKGLQDQPLHLLSNGFAKPTDTGALASSLGYDNSTTAEPSQDASSSPQLGVCSHVVFPPLPSQLPGDPGSGLTPSQAQVEAPVDLQAGQLLLHPAPAAAAMQSAPLQHLQRQPALLVAQQGVVVSASQALAQSAETRAAAGLSSTKLVGAGTVHRALPTVPIQGGWRGQASPGLEHSAWRQRTSTSGSGQLGPSPPLPQHPTPSRTFPLSLVHKLAGQDSCRPLPTLPPLQGPSLWPRGSWRS